MWAPAPNPDQPALFAGRLPLAAAAILIRSQRTVLAACGMGCNGSSCKLLGEGSAGKELSDVQTMGTVGPTQRAQQGCFGVRAASIPKLAEGGLGERSDECKWSLA